MNGWVAVIAVALITLLQYRQLREVTWTARFVFILLGAGTIFAAFTTGEQRLTNIEPLSGMRGCSEI
jgi:hypothetical protein